MAVTTAEVKRYLTFVFRVIRVIEEGVPTFAPGRGFPGLPDRLTMLKITGFPAPHSEQDLESKVCLYFVCLVAGGSGGWI